MSFCSNCGAELHKESKFCSNCGVPNPTTQHVNERIKEYAGNVTKCPSCGEEITSFTAICPSCGHEFNSAKVSDSLERFIGQVNKCEELIANSQSLHKNGWSSWSKTKKVWWVIFNILFTCIPLVVYMVLPLVLIKSTPRLSKEEKQMVSLIENFPFPNDRESILAALVFTKEKIDFMSKERVNQKTAYWMRLWCSKAGQLKQKADMLFPNDVIVKQSYSEILSDADAVKKAVKIKAIIGVAVLVAVVIFTIVRYGITDKVGIQDDKDYGATFEWQTNGLFEEIPKPTTNNGKIVMEAEQQISLELYNVETVDFENYVKACRESGFMYNITKTDMVFYATNEEGYNLNVFYYEDKNLINIMVSSYEIKTDTE